MADDSPGGQAIAGFLSGQQFQLNKFAIEEAPVLLEQEKLALKISTVDFDRRQKMAELLAQHSSSIPPGQNPLSNAARALTEMGNAAAESGLVEESTKYFRDASTIEAQQTDAAYKQWQETYQQTQYADQLLATVTDQQTLDQANAHIKMTTGKPSALEGTKYSPELIEQLKAASQSKRTAAQEALTRAQEAKAKIEAEAAKELGPLRKAEEEYYKVRTENANKVGGDGLLPKPKNVSAVTDALLKDNPSLDAPVARTFARSIALDVERKMSEEHMTQPQAVAASIKWAKEHGALAGIKPAHTAIGSSAKKPLPLPTTKEGFKDQMWYQTPSGPQWYDAETGSVYPPGEGPDGDDESPDEDDE